MPSFREYKSTRPARIMYDTVTFYHESFGYIYLVADQQKIMTFEGQQFQPVRMEVVSSQQSNTPVINATVKFSRLAQDFKQKLKLWRGASRVSPITCTYKRYDSLDLNAPLKPWTLYVSSVSMDDADVTVAVTVKNPMNNNIALLYNVDEFPGLVNV